MWPHGEYCGGVMVASMSGWEIELIQSRSSRGNTCPGRARRGEWALPNLRFREKVSGMRAILSVGLAGVVLAATAPIADAAGIAARKQKSGTDETRKAQAERAPKGPLLIVVSIGDQRVSLFANGELLSRGAVSTGMRGHPTPEGVFSVIQKDRYHRSNIYSSAPMPYMQRITWSGVALHAGVLPGYPASHGCIRLSYEYATMLWHVTQLGARVIVARNAVEPVAITHPALFAPKDDGPPVAASQTNAISTSSRVRVAASAEAPSATDAMPKEVAAPQDAKPVDPPKDALANPAEAPSDAEAKPADTPKDAKAPEPPGASNVAEAPRIVDPAQVIALAKAEFRAMPITVERPRKREQVSAFVSRKEGRLFVRQNFMPMFSVPVTIRHPEQPLGTHVFTAMGPKVGEAAMRWTVVSIPSPSTSRSEEREPEHRKSHRRTDAEIRKPVQETPAGQTPAVALDRIDMPKDAVDRISDLVAPGFSLIVSDHPISGETNDGTDFIVLTR